MLQHSSTYRMRKKIKKLEKKIKHFENDIENLKIGFADRYHAYLVLQLTKAKKDKNYEANQKRIAEKKQAAKVKSIKRLGELEKEYSILLSKYHKDIFNNHRAYITKKIKRLITNLIKEKYKINSTRKKIVFVQQKLKLNMIIKTSLISIINHTQLNLKM